ncbi:MAG: DUF29 domain-containing protein [Okeania sp. SIO2C9]|uniref:DUF29 domain-containing protein n=1 Tax=Okeania sp. SIO2C9 TaxID=2607791 RepID=UPI0013C21B86|nr:DUF29 domain-containing protein [Okeania sp. SIO2C9]NEQ73466.1 DUF29 domain-containing protein [Okeania sp. SIO2C9]
MSHKLQKIDTLYERDFLAWCEDTAAKLKDKDIENLDWENLIEEIETLGRSERRELNSRLTVLLTHILKRMYVNSPENFQGWELTIREQRRKIQELLTDSPSLKPYLEEILAKVYTNALDDVKFEYQETEFPSFLAFDTNTNSLLFEIYWK